MSSPPGHAVPMLGTAHLELTIRRGRRAGIVAFAAIVAGITAWWSFQILSQVWRTDTAAPATGSCHAGLTELLAAVENAHRTAVSGAGDDRAVVQRFRTALGRPWAARQALRAACQNDRVALQAFELIETLAYAEERAVRYEAGQVLPERRRIQALIPKLWSMHPEQR